MLWFGVCCDKARSDFENPSLRSASKEQSCRFNQPHLQLNAALRLAQLRTNRLWAALWPIVLRLRAAGASYSKKDYVLVLDK